MSFVVDTKRDVYLIGVPRLYTGRVERVAVDALKVGCEKLGWRSRVELAVFEAQSFWVIPELGVAGEAIGKSAIVVKVDFSRRDRERIIKEELPASIYHELAHLVREQDVGMGSTLLDALVSEGVACFVEQSLSPGRRIPYVARIKNEQRVWKKAAPLLLQRKYGYAEWFFGTKAIPRWAGYRLGYLLVSSFFAEQPTSLSKLVRMRSVDIFRGSEYTT